mmetsp:Transcript_102767/g.249734  ORF Transcript_102767/g.249734 Transcript_102767/m.249734 type:complete len:99 (+) Transcript_102767:2-298(+)
MASARRAQLIAEAAGRVFGTVKPTGVRSGRKVLRRALVAQKVTSYWPKTVEWMKFPEYVWEGREHLEEEESQLARVGKTRRKRGDGQSKRQLRKDLSS